jgi:type IV pilus assembly protein PilQ
MITASICLAQNDLGKQLSGQYNPSEIVTISKNASFDDAVATLNSVSQYNTGKSILSNVSIKSPIGIDLDKMPYKMAMNILVNMMNLTYSEEANRIVIQRKDVKNEKDGSLKKEELKYDPETYADADAREINISAVFFDADLEKSKARGIDWKLLLSHKGTNLGANLLTKSETKQTSTTAITTLPGFEASSEDSKFSSGDYSGSITSIFRFFEEQNLGEIIACPSIAVRDGQKGRIQVGSDFSIKQKDFSGNVIDKFYSAGSIIEVTPYVYKKNEMNYILLKINVERSSFYPGELTTEIKKTCAISDVLLLDGEQTVIGGLYINEETLVRNGIPFLKDLPWWVFGIKYLTGSDATVTKKKEVVIMLKANLLPTLEERFRAVKTAGDEMLKQKRQENDKELKGYKQNYTEEKGK